LHVISTRPVVRPAVSRLRDVHFGARRVGNIRYIGTYRDGAAAAIFTSENTGSTIPPLIVDSLRHQKQEPEARPAGWLREREGITSWASKTPLRWLRLAVRSGHRTRDGGVSCHAPIVCPAGNRRFTALARRGNVLNASEMRSWGNSHAARLAFGGRGRSGVRGVSVVSRRTTPARSCQRADLPRPAAEPPRVISSGPAARRPHPRAPLIAART